MQVNKYTKEQLIILLKNWVETHGHVPNKKELLSDKTMPSETAYRNKFGSWGKALLYCGYEIKQERKGHKTHGMRHTRISRIWRNMKTRCKNTKAINYELYGGRGISFENRWDKFECFLEDMYPSYMQHVDEFGESNTTLERINNDGWYSKDNCKWATKLEQGQNKRNNRLITYGNETLTLGEMARRHNLKGSLVQSRLSGSGWSVEKTFSTPVRRRS